MSKVDFTLILPCYNEHEHIDGSFKKIISELKKLKLVWEVILIDDKSKDNTKEILNKLINKYSKYNIKMYYHVKNMGRGATVSEGILKSEGFICGYIDIDCEVSPKYIPHFIKLLNLKKADLVVAKRAYKIQANSLLRYIASKMYAFLTKLVFALPISDSEAGYKFFVRSKIIPVVKKTKDTHWFWDTEIIVRSMLSDLKIAEIPVVFNRRKDKTSTVKIYQDTLRYLKSIVNLKRNLLYGSN